MQYVNCNSAQNFLSLFLKPYHAPCMVAAICFFSDLEEVHWEFSQVSYCQSTRREPTRHDLLSRLNIVARYSRQDTPHFTVTCNQPWGSKCSSSDVATDIVERILGPWLVKGEKQGNERKLHSNTLHKFDPSVCTWQIYLCLYVWKD